MTVREIQGHLEELYKVEVSPDLLSQATHAVWEDIQAWRNRPLQAGGRPRLDTNSLRWMVSQAAKEAGLHKHLHPHLLRHTFASHCFQRGILRGRSSSG